MHSLPDHVWAYRFVDGQAHQWPVPLAPDDEGIVTSLCAVEAMPSGLVEEDRVGRCPSCDTTLRLGDQQVDCFRCEASWAPEDHPRLVIRLDGLRCVTCLLRVGDDYSRLVTARLPSPAEFQHAVRNMRTSGPT
jgi:hypothetical protein